MKAALDTPVGGLLTFLARAEDTDGGMTAFEASVGPGQGPPLHAHLREDEAIYVLEGELRVRLGDDLRAAPAGTFVFIARGTPHTWRTADEGRARMLVVFAPAAPGMERFFERSAALSDDSRAGAFATFAEEAGMAILERPEQDSNLRPTP